MARSLRDPATTLRAPARVPRRAQAERLDQWELVELVAEGAYSRVYRSRPAGSVPDTATAYAAKRLKPEYEDDARAISFLRREARVGRAVTSPHLVPVLAAQTELAPFYLVMPWLDGETLAARITLPAPSRASSSRSAPFALWMARQVAEALDALDCAGWTHADVKPANIMVSPAGHATLLDLGLARRPADEDRGLDGCIMGTPWYMAPEMLLSTVRPDIRSDIFSLGAVLYEMLAGRRPFVAGDAATLIAAHRQEEPAELRSLAPHVPTEVAQLVHAMLAKEPLRRPQTPREVVRALVKLEIAHLGEMTDVDVSNVERMTDNQ